MTIKLKFLIALVICFTFPQLSHGQYFAEVNYGLNGSIIPATNSFSHTGIGFGFMDKNSALGAKLDFGLDQFRSNETGKETGSDLYRFSLQAICNITNLLNGRSYYNKFNVLVHGGLGYTIGSTISKTKYDDNIINVIMGATPKYIINNNLALILDASLIFNISQSYRFDIDYDNPVNNPKSFTGTTYNAGIGILYSFDSY